MARTFYLEILSPERVFFTGEAEGLTLPAIDGSMGILPGHEPMVTAVDPGEVRFKPAGEDWRVVIVSDGCVEARPGRVALLAASAERPEDIDEARARAAKERAEERLRQKQSREEYYRSQAALSRALARLKHRGK